MKESLLEDIVCPACLGNLRLEVSRRAEAEIETGSLRCFNCRNTYHIIGGLPILTLPTVKPYDWLSQELTISLKKYVPREALRKIVNGEINPKMLAPGEPLLTSEELREGEKKDSEDFWERTFGSPQPRIPEEKKSSVDTLIPMGKIEEAAEILDVGTGYGFMIAELVARFGATKKIIALDVSYTNLKVVKGWLRRLKQDNNVHLVVADALIPPFADNHFDSVESWFGVGNILGFQKAVFQAHRLLKKGKWFAISAPRGLSSIDAELRKLFTTKEIEEAWRKLGLLFGLDEIVRMFQDSSFQDIEWKEIKEACIVSGRK